MLLTALLISAALTPLAEIDDDAAFRAARASYDEFEFDTARARFEDIAARTDLDDVTRAHVLVWIGMCEAENGALSSAARAFENAALVDPAVKALPMMSPKARGMLEQARQRAAKKATGTKTPRPPIARAPPSEPKNVDAAPFKAKPTDVVGPFPFLSVGAAGLVTASIVVVVGVSLGVAAQAGAAEAQQSPDAIEASNRYAAAQQLATIANLSFVVAVAAAVSGGACVAAGVAEVNGP